MNRQQAAIYICPATGSSLQLEIATANGEEVVNGTLNNMTGDSFPIADGIPDFTWPRVLQASDEETRQSYEDMAQDYDRYAELPFITYRAGAFAGGQEDVVRHIL